MYPVMFPHLPEHLASRYVILYACVTMVLDSNGPIIQFKSMSFKQKQKLKIVVVLAKCIFLVRIFIISTTKRDSEHTNSGYFLA